MTVTPEDYARNEGLNCPVCDSGYIEADNMQVDGSLALQAVSCIDCESSWTDEYTLAGYVDLEVKTKESA